MFPQLKSINLNNHMAQKEVDSKVACMPIGNNLLGIHLFHPHSYHSLVSQAPVTSSLRSKCFPSPFQVSQRAIKENSKDPPKGSVGFFLENTFLKVIVLYSKVFNWTINIWLKNISFFSCHFWKSSLRSSFCMCCYSFHSFTIFVLVIITHSCTISLVATCKEK